MEENMKRSGKCLFKPTKSNLKLRYPSNQYQVVLADPPWSYTGQQDKWAAAAKFYNTMTAEDICAIPMKQILTRPGVLFLWATGPKLHAAINAIESWDLHYRGVAFVWIKTKKDGTPIGAQGVRPSIVKPLTEFVLSASTQPEGRPLPLASEAVVQTVFAPKSEHSVKPPEVMERINLLYPTCNKLEMFARRKAQGWDSWGDQV
jgi:N6-adenosine-specific RNA methylase IME4